MSASLGHVKVGAFTAAHGDVAQWYGNGLLNRPPKGVASSSLAVSAKLEGTAKWLATGPESRGVRNDGRSIRTRHLTSSVSHRSVQPKASGTDLATH